MAPVTKQSLSDVHQFRLVMIGDTCVGKSSIIRRLKSDQFLIGEPNTLPVSFCAYACNCRNGGTVKLQIWDTAGQERFHSMVSLFYRNAHAAVVVFDITNPESFCNAKVWAREVRENVGADKIFVMLAGNKTDMKNSRLVNQLEAQNYAEDNGLDFMETSAKSGNNVQEMFEKISEIILKQKEEKKPTDTANLGSTISIKKCQPACSI